MYVYIYIYIYIYIAIAYTYMGLLPPEGGGAPRAALGPRWAREARDAERE